MGTIEMHIKTRKKVRTVKRPEVARFQSRAQGRVVNLGRWDISDVGRETVNKSYPKTRGDQGNCLI